MNINATHTPKKKKKNESFRIHCGGGFHDSNLQL